MIDNQHFKKLVISEIFTYIIKPTIVSQKHTYTTSDYMEWSTMLNLVRWLYRDGNFRMSLLIGTGCFFGLRISDLLSLTWEMLLAGDSFMIEEKRQVRSVQFALTRTLDCISKIALMLLKFKISQRSASCLKRR